MRDTIFQAIVSKLQGLSAFQGSEGTKRVYDWPNESPDGYPYVVIGSESLSSEVLDNQRDLRLYNFTITIVGEKFGEQSSPKTQSQALLAMRNTEAAVLTAFDADNDLGLMGSGVIRTLPTSSTYAYTDGGTRVLLAISLQVQTQVAITM